MKASKAAVSKITFLWLLLALNASAQNLIPNPSLETTNPSNSKVPLGWTKTYWGTNTSTFSYVNGGANDGSYSVQVQMTSYTSGAAEWYFASPVSVTPGTVYAFSDYYISNVSTDIQVQYTMANGGFTYQDLGQVTPSSTWTKVTRWFQVPAGVTSLIVLHVINSVGTLQTDSYSLAVAPTTNAPNLISNPSVEIPSASNIKVPLNWVKGFWGTNTPTFSYTAGSGAYDGNYSLSVQITSYSSGDAKWVFNAVPVTGGSLYYFSDYYISNVATDIQVGYIAPNGTVKYQDLGPVAPSATWAQATRRFMVPPGVTSVVIYHALQSVGTLQTDAYSLTLANPQPPSPAGNLLTNPAMITADPNNINGLPGNWVKAGYGTNTVSYSYSPSIGFGGTGSLNVNISSFTNGSASWYNYPQIAPVAGQQYQYSEYYTSDVQTQVQVGFTQADGTVFYGLIGMPEPSSAWKAFTSNFVIPKGTVSFAVFHVLKRVGNLSISAPSLLGYTPVGFQRPIVSITADDGYEDAYTQALPILQNYNMSMTAYVISGLVDTSGHLSTPEVLGLYNAGMEIGAHSVTHPDLTLVSADQLNTELTVAPAFLQGIINSPVPDLAYPYGSYNSTVLAAAQPLYRSARGVENGLNSRDNFNLYDIKAQNIFNTTTIAQVADWVAQAKATNTWLVLVYHQVLPDCTGNQYCTTTSDFAGHLSAIQAGGVVVETMNAALNEVLPQLTP